MDILPALRAAATAALDLLAPPLCPVCSAEPAPPGSPGPTCRSRVRPLPPSPCPRCAGPLGPGAAVPCCADCAQLRPRFSGARAAGSYPGLLGEMVRRAKYGGDRVLASPLADLMAAALRRAPALRPPPEMLVPVPARRGPGRVAGPPASRGGRRHLAGLLADRLGGLLHLPVAAGALIRVGDPLPQAGLPRSVRRRSARGTVDLRPGLRGRLAVRRVRGRVVLLVDDVLTTGATADACARVLLGAGARAVHVVVAARA